MMIFLHEHGDRVVFGDGSLPVLPRGWGAVGPRDPEIAGGAAPGPGREPAASVVPCEASGCRHFAAPGGKTGPGGASPSRRTEAGRSVKSKREVCPSEETWHSFLDAFV